MTDGRTTLGPVGPPPAGQKVYLKTISKYKYFFCKVKVINIHDRYQTKLLSVRGFTQNGQDGVSSK